MCVTLQERLTTTITSKKKQETTKKIETVKKLSFMKRTSTGGTPYLAQENRQKLEGRKSRHVKHHNLPHKFKLGLTISNANISSSTSTTNKQDTKGYISETPKKAPVAFVSRTEIIKRFQSNIRDFSLSSVLSNTKPKLTLTRPKEREFETKKSVRPTRVKSSAQLDEKLMVKFKAWPLNKKTKRI
ncbi:hypothetical protein PIB30_047690 [Stylosanthes scabra]|uniref:TPX2 central domain-containing protein n=1 Tax=Stylosanthes scabra TaxID=79078 RepID=A0ABU6ZFK7_9FABA|nr:hypothetical protein [Stylosanthes scabra]